MSDHNIKIIRDLIKRNEKRILPLPKVFIFFLWHTDKVLQLSLFTGYLYNMHFIDVLTRATK